MAKVWKGIKVWCIMLCLHTYWWYSHIHICENNVFKYLLKLHVVIVIILKCKLYHECKSTYVLEWGRDFFYELSYSSINRISGLVCLKLLGNIVILTLYKLLWIYVLLLTFFLILLRICKLIVVSAYWCLKKKQYNIIL